MQKKKKRKKTNYMFLLRKSVLSLSLSLSLSFAFCLCLSLSKSTHRLMLQRHVGKHEAAIERLNRVAGRVTGCQEQRLISI